MEPFPASSHSSQFQASHGSAAPRTSAASQRYPVAEGSAVPHPVGPRAGRVPARLLNGTPISAQDARRIALNAGISPLLLGHHGSPLYLGRTVRFVTPAQRKVLLALYETCIVHGCHIPAHLCEIHHLGGGWKLGTPTDIDQLAPACGWHNRWIDHHPDHITQTTDTHGRTVIKIQPLWKSRRNAYATDPATARPAVAAAVAASLSRHQPTTGDRQPGAP